MQGVNLNLNHTLNTYTYGTRNTKQDDCLSNASRYSEYSYISPPDSGYSTERIHIKQHKSKITLITKSNNHLKNKKHLEKTLENQTYKQIPSQVALSSKIQPVVSQSLSYDNIKPFFNWNKYTFLCGYEGNQLGQKGCLCHEPCPWKKAWTKNTHHQDQLSFKRILQQNATEASLTQIGKDIGRTHPECPTFSRSPQFRQMLKQVLIAYSIYDMEIGYVQGVNMIAGVLLYHIKNAQQTFWALVEMMQYQQLRMVYLHGFEHLRLHCRRIDFLLKNKVFDLYEHMQRMGVTSECFLTGWLLSLMSNAIPMQYMHQVLDRFRKGGWRYMYQLALTYLLFLKQYLLMSDDECGFLMNLSTKCSRELGIQWTEMIESADKLIL